MGAYIRGLIFLGLIYGGHFVLVSEYQGLKIRCYTSLLLGGIIFGGLIFGILRYIVHHFCMIIHYGDTILPQKMVFMIYEGFFKVQRKQLSIFFRKRQKNLNIELSIHHYSNLCMITDGWSYFVFSLPANTKKVCLKIQLNSRSSIWEKWRKTGKNAYTIYNYA